MSDDSSSPRRADPGLGGIHEFPRRAFTVPASNRRETSGGGGDGKKLTVGRDIKLAGQITSCDTLVVEGEVEADLNDSRTIEVSRSGAFKGSAAVDTAIIAGTFDGQLTARNRLVVHGTGRLTGKVRYGQIEIESGAEVSGDVQKIESDDSGGVPR
ncbi:MAG: polymer-forming cytoskeletal protein [Alphaproteobacteria bacterium]